MSAGAGEADRGRVPPTRPEGFGPPDALRTIVTDPRATMRWLLDHGDGGLWAWLLAGALVTLAAPMAIDATRAFARPPLLLPGSWLVPALAVGLCALAALFFLVGAAVAARVMGGVGRPGETLRAMAWGGLPLVTVMPFVLASGFLDPFHAPVAVAVLRLLGLAGTIASCALTVSTFAETQRFSWRRATLALALAVALAYGLGLLAMPVLPLLLFALTGGVE